MRWRVVIILIVGTLSLPLLGDLSASSPVTVAGAAASSPAAFSYRLDTSFAGDGTMEFPSWTDVRALVLSADGSAIAQLRRVDTSGAVVDVGVARVRTDGTLDPQFGAGGATPGIVDSGGTDTAFMVRSDGRFLIGTRQYLASGAVDQSFGVDGYVHSGGVVYGSGYDSAFETTGHRLIFALSRVGLGGCYLYPIDDLGVIGEPLLIAGVRCATAVPIVLKDQSTVVVLHDAQDGLHLVRLRADGTVDTSSGNGTGVTAVDMTSIGVQPLLADATLSPDGKLLLLLDGPLFTSQLFKVGLDGTLDPAFGNLGGVVVDGVAQAVTADPSGIAVGVGYTFALHSNSPDRPAILRLTTSGALDQQFNPVGLQPGWLDITELGMDVNALAGRQVRVGPSGLLMSIGVRPTDPNQWQGVLIRLARTPPLVATVDVSATASRVAERLGVITTP